MTPRALFFFVLVSFVSMLSGSAFAQTITVNTKNIGRGPEHDSKNLAPTDINYADCVADDIMNVGIMVSGVMSGQSLQVWGGTNEGCATPEGRNTLGKDICWLVYENSTVATGDVTLQVRNVIPHAGDTGMASDCDSDRQSGYTIRFIIFNGDAQSNASGIVTGKYDLKGPAAPTTTGIGVGDGRLYPTWDGSKDDPWGYQIFCEEADPTGGSCAATTLIPGMVPPIDAVESARATQFATEGVVEGLTNYTNYACAVGTIDQLKNIGPLSELVCGTPQPVNGYFKAYKSAGGQGGGGYCSFGRGGSGTAAAVASLGLAGVVLAMRRRRRGSRP